MKMAKRLLAVALAGVLALSVLTGCGSSSSNNKVTGTSLASALTKMGVKTEYDSKLDDVAKNTLGAIQTIVNADADKKITLDNAVVTGGALTGGKVIYSYELKVWGSNITEDSVAKPVSNALEIVQGQKNADKKVQVALVKTENATEDSSLQAHFVEKELTTAYYYGSSTQYDGQTGKLGTAKTADGKYILVVIVTEKAADNT